MKDKPIKFSILLFDGVELLDFSGPYEVFFTASRLCRIVPDGVDFYPATIGETSIVKARGGLKVLTDYQFYNAPHADILIIPGGVLHAPLSSPSCKSFIQNAYRNETVVASVCNGALLLAHLRLLNGRQCTTHWEDLPLLRNYAECQVVENVPFVDTGPIVTSAGITAGITMSLHLLTRLSNKHHAEQTAKQMACETLFKDIEKGIK